MLKLLMRAGGKSETIRMSRMSMQTDVPGAAWKPAPIRESFGIHPMKVDPMFRASMAQMKEEVLASGWAPMTPLDFKYVDIMVDRCGDTPDAFMITRGVVLEVEPRKPYYIMQDEDKGDGSTSKPYLALDLENLEAALAVLPEEEEEDDDDDDDDDEDAEGGARTDSLSSTSSSLSSRRASTKIVNLSTSTPLDHVAAHQQQIVAQVRNSGTVLEYKV